MSKLLNLSKSITEKALFFSMISFGTGAALLTYLPNTYLVEKYKSFFQLYRKGFPATVPEDINDLLEEAAEELELTIKQTPVELFSTIGYETMRFGSAWTISGCFIGVPSNFSYENADDVDTRILVDGNPVPWDSEVGRNFKESLVLSRLAKKYAIARELCIAHSPTVYLYASYPALITVAIANINDYIYERVNWNSRPPLIKYAFYVVLIVFAFGLYFMLKDTTAKFYEYRADLKLANANKDYILGGKEYCDKMMARNMALRDLFSSGKSDFATDGEEINLFRSKHLSLRERRKLFEDKLTQQSTM